MSNKPQASAVERRKSKRRPILATFSVFIVVPKKGVHRLQVHDISEHGIGFDLDAEGETPEEFPIAAGESLDLRFYMNQSLYLPLTVNVVRVDDRGSIRRVGAEFDDKKSKTYKAFLSFLEMLDSIIDEVRLDA